MLYEIHATIMMTGNSSLLVVTILCQWFLNLPSNQAWDAELVWQKIQEPLTQDTQQNSCRECATFRNIFHYFYYFIKFLFSTMSDSPLWISLLLSSFSFIQHYDGELQIGIHFDGNLKKYELSVKTALLHALIEVDSCKSK